MQLNSNGVREHSYFGKHFNTSVFLILFLPFCRSFYFSQLKLVAFIKWSLQQRSLWPVIEARCPSVAMPVMRVLLR